jgi:hypothetical protein
VERIRTALRERISKLRPFPADSKEPWVISAVAGTGVQELILELGVRIEKDPVLRTQRKKSGPQAFLAGETGQPVEALTHKSTLLPDDESLRRAK